MALQLKIRVTQLDENFTFFIVEDENYTLDPVNQYGDGTNPARADLGLFLYVTKKEVGDDEDTLIFGGSADNLAPVTASSWQISYTEDNWYEHVLIAAVAWDIGVTYVADDIAYYTNRLYKAVAPVLGSAPGSVEGEWLDVTEDHEDILTNGTSTYLYTYTLNDARLEISGTSYAKLVAKSSKNGQCLNCDHDNTEARNLIYFHLNAAQVGLDQQLYTQMQYNIETLKDLTGVTS